MKTNKIITLLITLMIVSLGIAQPTTSATTPTKLAVDVKSVFSDAYTNISTVELFPNWGQGTLYTNYVVPSSSPANNVIKYSNLDYQGINITVGGNPPGVDFSAMTTLHIDVWTPDVASFKLFPIDDKTDQLFKTLTPTQAGWNSYDIVLATDFPTLNKASIRQFKFEKTAFKYKAEVNTIYFDNIYFWRAPSPAGTPTISFTIPAKLSSDASFSLSSLVSSDSPGAFTFTSSNTSVATISGDSLTIVGAGTAVITANQAASGSFIAGSKTANLVVVAAPPTAAPNPPTRNAVDVISLFSNQYTNITIDTWSASYDDSSVADVVIAGNDAKKITFTNFLGVQFNGPGNHIDATPMTNFHIDIWTPTATLDKFFNLKFSNWGGGSGEANEIQFSATNASNPTLPNPNPGTWISLDIPLSKMAGLRNDLAEFIISSGGPGSLGTVYVDNIYFWKAPSVVFTPAPNASAQTFCSATTVASLVATGTDLKWYANTTGGTALLSSDVLTTQTYYVSQTLNTIESARTAVAVTITAPLTTSAIRMVGAANAVIPTVVIGTQTWTAKNLDVATYSDGTVIPQVTDPMEWANLTTGAWCYYNNDPANGAIYGKLYNRFAVNDSRGLAPIGFHIPTENDWTTLNSFLGGNIEFGGKIKEIGTLHWSSPNYNATNSSNFTALPGGSRDVSGSFSGINYSGFWWTSSLSIENNNFIELSYNSGSFSSPHTNGNYAHSVRLIKD